jgi:hypothetical protein
MEVADLPVLRSVDRGRHDRDVLLEGDHRCAGLRLAGDSASLPRALDEEPERVAVAHDLAHDSHRLAIGFASSHGEGSERADQLAEPWDAVGLDLRHVIDRARRARSECGWVEPREVVER